MCDFVATMIVNNSLWSVQACGVQTTQSFWGQWGQPLLWDFPVCVVSLIASVCHISVLFTELHLSNRVFIDEACANILLFQHSVLRMVRRKLRKEWQFAAWRSLSCL